MPAVVIIGAQWGDEGKGKVVDRLAGRAELVVRFQGGNNAGHTLVVDGHKTVVHLVPSGVLDPTVTNVIAQGVVMDPAVLLGELDGLIASGVLQRPEQVLVSDGAAVITPYHIKIDQLREARLAGGKIGTTGRGIGPAYEDVAARRAVRAGDLLDEPTLRARLARVLDERNAVIEWLGGEALDLDHLVADLLAMGERLRPHITETGPIIRDALAADQHVIFEGAQGVLLDVLHGTYPFVTSSHTGSGAVATGAGVAPRHATSALGVVKAYSTRVGAGPLPTEIEGPVGDQLRSVGHEFGSTTGRPRRCGWLDLPALRYAAQMNGFVGLALTKIDVLSGLDELKLCVGYEIDGKRVDALPSAGRGLEGAKAIYETMPGWSQDITTARSLEALPSQARAYVQRISDEVGVPVVLVGVGPGRSETIVLADLWG